MNIKETFLQLTSNTYPYGHEPKLRRYLPSGTKRDKYGNYFLKIGNSETVFTSHLDTANKEFGPVKHVIEGNIIKTDGKSILGADDKAGVTVLLYLIEQKVPGTYYFFIGEEVGCIGSKAASKDDFSSYKRVVSFDRRDVCSVITHQSSKRCCSKEFANDLSSKYISLGLELKPDDTGIYTDSAEFMEIVSECTNISVGYYKEHTYTESQDIDFLEKLCIASSKINWESLPSVRDPKIKEYKEYHHYSAYENRGNRWNNTHDRNKNKGTYNNRYNDVWDEDTPYDNSFDENNYSEYLYKNRNKKNKERLDANSMDIEDYVKRAGTKDYYLPFREYLDEKLLDMDEYDIILNQFVNNS